MDRERVSELSREGHEATPKVSMTRSNAIQSSRRPLPLPAFGLIGCLSLILATASVAQISRYPEPGNSGLAEILSGVGAGSTGRSNSPSGVSVEPGRSEAVGDSALRAELGYLRWERWWNESLYDVLRADRKALEPVDGLVLLDAMDLLRQALVTGTVEERRAAALALSRTGSESVVGDLVFALTDAPEEVRSSLILALGMSGSEEARSYLDAFVRDSRFGRGVLGSRRQPVPQDLRCVAAVALGLLPAREACTAIHDILIDPAAHHPDLYLSAALGLGLQGAGTPKTGRLRQGRFGPVAAAVNPCARNLGRYLELLDDAAVDSRARGALLDAMVAAAPREFGVLDKALDFLASEDVVLARSAAFALQRIGDQGRARALAGLWSRVADRSDATAAGLALISIGRLADEEAFRKLVESRNLNPGLQPYQAVALAEASRNRPLRRAAALLCMRSMLDRAIESDQSSLGAIMLALGLLHDDGSLERFEKIAKSHDAEGLRAAATLSLGLVGGGSARGELADDLVGLEGEAGFLVHHGALALALSDGRASIDRLASILERRRDPYSLGGIARAIGLVGDPQAIPRLIKIAAGDDESPEARAFAIGAIGLLLERRDFPMSRLRAIAPLPLASPILRETLSHL